MRALAAPVANNGDETITAAGNSWGGAARVGGLDIIGTAPDGNAGFKMSYRNMSDMSMSAGDEANLWVKPIDMVKLSYGKYDNNTLRSGLEFGSWNWMRPTAWIADDDGLLMSGNGSTGLMAEITPMEGLYIQALVPITQENVKAGTTYKNLRGGFAYEVPGLVKVKGQYIGKGASSEDVAAVKAADGVVLKADATLSAEDADYELATGESWLREPVKGAAATTKDGNSNCTLEAEVDVLAVEGLFAGVGFQYNVVKDGDKQAETDKTTGDPVFQNKMKIALGASYQVMPELKVSASGAFFTYYKYAEDKKIDPRFQFGLGVDYDLGDGLALNADCRYLSVAKMDGEKADKTDPAQFQDHIAFSVGVKKSVSSNGSIGVAFQGVTNSGNLASVKGVPNDDKEYKNFVWAIPVAIEVAF
ncbi:MAG TPA: hypothetical protein DCZ76_12095 [Treponema sp.]|nr:hypothetical protein [Treponema sp.]